MHSSQLNVARELRLAKSLFGALSRVTLGALKMLIEEHGLSVANGDIIYVGNGWYVSHAGLLRLAERRCCIGIHTRALLTSSDPAQHRWVFKAIVFKSA